MKDEFVDAAAALDAPGTPPPEEGIDEVLVWRALGSVIDPEIGLDIVSLGLVYEVECIENAVRVTYTLTTPGCPMEAVITAGIERAVAGVPGVEHVLPRLVWQPEWNPGRIREGAW
jgi:metal-sulfur cluster biosynthetic enzyme